MDSVLAKLGWFFGCRYMQGVTITKTKSVALLGGDPGYLRRFRMPLVRELRRRGYDVTAIAAGGDALLEEELDAVGAGFRSYQLDRGSVDVRSEGPTMVELLRILIEERPDYLISYTPKLITYSSLLARLIGIPRRGGIFSGLGTAFVDNGTTKRRVLRNMVTAALRVGLPGTEALVFMNPNDRDDLGAFGVIPSRTRKVVVGGSGVSLEEFPKTPVPVSPRFLLIGRMIGEKGVREFMAAATALRAKGVNATFELLGPIDLTHPEAVAAAELEAWGEQEGCAFLGKTSDVRPYLQRASVFVLPSYREGLPRSGLEALATGRAVICSDVPGCRELVGPEGNALLVPARETEGLQAAMELLANDPERVRRMGEAGRRYCETRFAVDIVVNETLAGLGLV